MPAWPRTSLPTSCVCIQDPRQERSSSTVTKSDDNGSERDLRENPIAEEVSLGVVESTSDQWKPYFEVLDGSLFASSR
jgi:hypothetical protein